MPTTKPRPPKSPDLYGFGEGAEMDEAIFEAMPDDGALPDRPMMGLSAEPIIQMRGVYKFFGDLLALNNVSLDIMAGEKVVIIGPSGSGKSTLLRSINRLETIDKGNIIVEGMDIYAPENDINLIRQDLGMVFQSFNLFPHKTVLDNLTMAPMRLRKIPRSQAEAQALELLRKVDIVDKAKAFPNTLSGGQKQRVAIARALAMTPKIMLFDEPTSALDPELVGEVVAVIQDLSRSGMTMVMATHQMDFARALATEILFMERGEIIEQGRPADLLAPGSGSRTQDFCMSILNLALDTNEAC